MAEPWPRLIAWVIDTIIIFTLVAAMWIPVVRAYMHNYQVMIKNPDIDAPGFQAVSGHVLTLGVLTGFASAAVAAAYNWLLIGFCGTTIGKRALGMRVVTVAGTKAGQRAAMIRAAVPVVGEVMIPLTAFSLYCFLIAHYSLAANWLLWLLLPIFFAADSMQLLTDSCRQSVHDKAAGTLVIHRVSRGGSGGRKPGE